MLTTRQTIEQPDFMFHGLWDEVFDHGVPRATYAPLFDRLTSLPKGEMRGLDERLDAVMREMGVTFDIARDRPWGRRPWYCDLLPQIFTPAEWEPLARGFRQRLHAFDLFLRDIYGEKKILREGRIPLQPVLASSHYQIAATGLKPPGGSYLHLSGLSVCRLPNGALAAKHHYFSNASGMSYMMQNRRALARVMPGAFQDYTIHPIADVGTDILEVMRSFSTAAEPTVVLLSAGTGSAVYSEHSFLARRMGIPLVQGGDLLVVNERVYLKTVSGLERVEVIYTRVSDPWLDPLAFRRDSLLGVPGLVNCMRRGTVCVINAVGSQIADDRSLLLFADQIISYYLGETPILPSVHTYWLGDIDQREMVMENLDAFTVRPLYGERVLTPPPGQMIDAATRERVQREVLANASGYVAQPKDCDASTVCAEKGKLVPRYQDHILFALRDADGEYNVFPGGLTRISTEQSPWTASELGGGSKDTWVEIGPASDDRPDRRPAVEVRLPSQHVTSRVAESFYWIGRYLERASNLACMISVIESLEMEELNATERNLYRPVWNRLLPPLEAADAQTRRNLSSISGRYRMVLDIDEPGSLAKLVRRAAGNAESILECLSLDAWGVVSSLRDRFGRTRFRPGLTEAKRAAATSPLCEAVGRAVPQFFGVARSTMIEDGGWLFCEIGQHIERATITANAGLSIAKALVKRSGENTGEHAQEIQLSAFLRLLNSRDAYRRVFQMRTEAAPVFEFLFDNPVVPRSVRRCLDHCEQMLRRSGCDDSPAALRTLGGIAALRDRIGAVEWETFFDGAADPATLTPTLESLLRQTLDVHDLIADGFLNHQLHAEGHGPG